MGSHVQEIFRFEEHRRTIEDLRRERSKHESDLNYLETIRNRTEEAVATEEQLKNDYEAQGKALNSERVALLKNWRSAVERWKAKIEDLRNSITEVDRRLAQTFNQASKDNLGVRVGDRLLKPEELANLGESTGLSLDNPIDRRFLFGDVSLNEMAILLQKSETRKAAQEFLLDLVKREQFEGTGQELASSFLSGEEVFDAWFTGSIRRIDRDGMHWWDRLPSADELQNRIIDWRGIPQAGSATNVSLTYLIAGAIDKYSRVAARLDQRLDWATAADADQIPPTMSNEYFSMLLNLAEQGHITSAVPRPGSRTFFTVRDLLQPFAQETDMRRAARILAMLIDGALFFTDSEAGR